VPSDDPAQPSRSPRARNARPPVAREGSGPQPWTRDAACVAGDPDLFFPVERRDPVVGEAKRVCASCPVQAECRDYSLATRQEHGIWGGLDEWERASLLARQRRHGGGGAQGAA